MADLSPADAVALLYRRAGFGASPAEITAGVVRGYSATVDRLLEGLGAAPDPAADAAPPPSFAPRLPRDERSDQAGRRRQRAQYRNETPAAQDWWMNRLIVTDTPLREKMTLLWSGHFATGIAKVADPQLMYNQNELFRKSSAESFLTLTRAVARDPAMMIWLDTNQDNAAHPNENFARELMELFTIGLGNYTQSDVNAAAAAFTGYSLDRSTEQFVYRPSRHSGTVDNFLGYRGDLSGDQVIEIVLDHPASARFIVAWAWSHLAYPVDPGDPIVTDLLGSYAPDSPFPQLLRGILLHPEFQSTATLTGLVKQPLEHMAGAARALGLGPTLRPTAGGPARRTSRLVAWAEALGQTMWNPPSVAGWPQNGYWLNTATALARWQAGRALANAADLSALDDRRPADRVAAVGELLGVPAWSGPTDAALTKVAASPAQMVALAISSPEHVLA